MDERFFVGYLGVAANPNLVSKPVLCRGQAFGTRYVFCCSQSRELRQSLNP